MTRPWPILALLAVAGALPVVVGCQDYGLAEAPDPHDLVECEFEVVGDEDSPWELYTCNPFFPPPLHGGWVAACISGYDILVVDVLGTPLYQMWYGGGDTELEMDPETKIDHIGYAVSTNGVDWERHEGNPVLSPSGGQAFDAIKTYNPTVWFDEDAALYHMWYAADGTTAGTQIGHATSVDGLSWEKDPMNPVIGVDEMDATVFTAFTPGDVVADDDGLLHMFYGGLMQVSFTETQYAIGHATSHDGSTWNMHDGQAILQGNAGHWDSKVAAFPDVFIHEDEYYMFYVGSQSVANQGNYYFVDDAHLGYASSSDAIHWTRETPDAPLPLEYVNPAYPRVYYVYGRLHIWFTDRFESTMPDDSKRDLAWLNFGLIDW